MENWFDVLSKALAAGEVSRREVLRRVGGAAGGVLLTALGIGCVDDAMGPEVTGSSATAVARGRCKKVGQKCRQDQECCSGFCPPETGTCACFPGGNVCPRTGICVYCGFGQVFNPDTCQCECPACTEGGSCDTGFQCCNDSFDCACFTTAEGTSFCGGGAFCEDLVLCTSSSDCPEGFECTVNTCCGPEGVCSPPCGSAAGAADARTGPRNIGR